jgi:hypothetical protein
MVLSPRAQRHDAPTTAASLTESHAATSHTMEGDGIFQVVQWQTACQRSCSQTQKDFSALMGFSLFFSLYLMAMDGWMHTSVADTPFLQYSFFIFSSFRFFLHEIVPPIV